MNIEEEKEYIAKLIQLKNVLEMNKFEGLNRKVQLRPIKWEKDKETVTAAVFVLKWGGELTHSGVNQAQELGKSFREKMYNEDEGNGGLLRLHSTYRHDLKCYTSDEGRCQKTAAAFLKGLLFLEGPLAPVLAIMVRNDEKVQAMLNDNSDANNLLARVKTNLYELINAKIPISEKFKQMYKEEPTDKVKKYFEKIEIPFEKLQEI